MKLLPKRLRRKKKQGEEGHGKKSIRSAVKSWRRALSVDKEAINVDKQEYSPTEAGLPDSLSPARQNTVSTLNSLPNGGSKKQGKLNGLRGGRSPIRILRKNVKGKRAIDNNTGSNADQANCVVSKTPCTPGAIGGERSKAYSAQLKSSLNSSGSTQPATNRRNTEGYTMRQHAGSRTNRFLHANDQTTADLSAYKMYATIPELESTKLPRGGLSMDTEAVGRIQFGIPPETIKDSMSMGINVPLFYIVPVERFCRELGPALGVNLAEFEFPAYFNFFIQKKRCTLIVDSEDAERNIRRVFGETLLGPAQFRRKENIISFQEEDFAPDFPREAIPDFYKELKHFRVMPDGKELEIETLLNFTLFEGPVESRGHEHLGVPPVGEDIDSADDSHIPEMSDFSRVKLCERAVLYPPAASPEEIANKTCKRVEVFKVPGSGEYILHDIDENNIIVGKGNFSGNLRVSASMGVNGWGDLNEGELNEGEGNIISNNNSLKRRSTGSEGSVPRNIAPPTFHPPSFGVTVLGNSHGFDKSGSVSGYVLWINGRGVMIDPPPYSSATLEREGIRPRTIVGIILTHCHADHDAGAFQKVLTGAPVVVITTPTIYKSFIRKYAALSALSPALLRHSHRHKPAIIGMPLRFQGATFHFTYTLHSIPCVGFRVDWRGRSMVFTGDHFNSPEGIGKLQEQGILSAARAEDLRNLPMQNTDLLLHEAGVPPLHTPLEVLMALPQRIKDRLYVVHTQKLPEGCELRVAPIGTAGTIRLDEKEPSTARPKQVPKLLEGIAYDDEVMFQSMWMSNEYDTFNESGRHIPLSTSFTGSDISSSSRASSGVSTSLNMVQRNSLSYTREPPPVALRPTSSTDAWFILNLLSAVPFLSGLSYASTMEVLETARVDAYSKGDIVVPAARRSDVLCVIWEGTCMEREILTNIYDRDQDNDVDRTTERTVWHAGDWTGPVSLQPEKSLSGESKLSKTHDIVAMSSQGVKLITVEYSNLHSILKSGSPRYRRYLDRKDKKHLAILQNRKSAHLFANIVEKIEVMDIIECNTTLRKISAVQKRHLESLAEGPFHFEPGERLWRSGTPVETAFIIVGGTASFLATRRNGSSVGARVSSDVSEDESERQRNSLCERMRKDAERVRMFETAGKKDESDDKSISGSSLSSQQIDAEFDDFDDFEEYVDNSNFQHLFACLERRADIFNGKANMPNMSAYLDAKDRRPSASDRSEFSDNSTNALDELYTEMNPGHRKSIIDRHANRQLVRLYNSRAFTAGLVFSRGHFLGDVSKMVGGLLSSNYEYATYYDEDDTTPLFNKGQNSGRRLSGVETIHEQMVDQPIVHGSTLAAGKDGCVVLSFSRINLVPFFDEHPGLLLSLLGTQVVL